MPNLILFPAQVDGLNSRKDRTLTVRLATQELPPEKSAELFRLQNAMVFVAVKEEDFGREELEAMEAAKADAAEFGTKTAAQRLRAVLYRLWEVQPDGYDDFRLFYESRMEKLIEQIKRRLP